VDYFAETGKNDGDGVVMRKNFIHLVSLLGAPKNFTALRFF